MATSRPVLCGSIAGRPGRFGVAMHSAAFRALGLDYAYVAFGCEDTAGAVTGMRALGLRGLGVTMPHKQTIAAFLDDLAPDARAIGAVNTVVNDGGRLVGHNVDWAGAIEAFREVGLEPRGLNAAVVGAGGGARAIAYGLVQAGACVRIFNRDPARGRDVADALDCIYAGPPEEVACSGPLDLLVHATPVGFHDPDTMLPLAGALRDGVCVFDAVPMPIETRLLREARARGCRTIAGVRMQLHQAARQFELYTGRAAPLAVMAQALANAIAQPGG
ncbi:MAG: shikimate dehydrogenase [Defluviicoccus sp.]|nr:MAG: shikimate dehydrogenase [Defluviicoccus sp.]